MSQARVLVGDLRSLKIFDNKARAKINPNEGKRWTSIQLEFIITIFLVYVGLGKWSCGNYFSRERIWIAQLLQVSLVPRTLSVLCL